MTRRRPHWRNTGIGSGYQHSNRAFVYSKKITLLKKSLGGPGRPVKGKSGQAGRPAGPGMPEAPRIVSGIEILLGKFGPQNAQKCYEFKCSPCFMSISLDVRVGPASLAGRPQPASAGRRSWELVLALTPASVFDYSEEAGSGAVALSGHSAAVV